MNQNPNSEAADNSVPAPHPRNAEELHRWAWKQNAPGILEAMNVPLGTDPGPVPNELLKEAPIEWPDDEEDDFSLLLFTLLAGSLDPAALRPLIELLYPLERPSAVGVQHDAGRDGGAEKDDPGAKGSDDLPPLCGSRVNDDVDRPRRRYGAHGVSL